MLQRTKFIVSLAAFAILAGCAASRETPVGASGPSAFGGGAQGCRGPIAEFQAIMDSDDQTGNVNHSVYRRVMADLAGVKDACAAGHPTIPANSGGTR